MPKAEKTKPVSLRELRKTFRKFLEEYDITLAEFGGYAGLSKGMLSLFMNGKRDLSREAWVRVVVATQNLPKLQTEIARRKAEDGAKRAAGTAARLGVARGALHAALGVPDSNLAKALNEKELERREQELEQSKQELAAIEAAGEKIQRGDVKFSQTADGTWHALVAVSSSETDRKRRQLAALENLQSIDDPIISELIESFRREVAEKDKQLEALSGTVEKNGRTA